MLGASILALRAAARAMRKRIRTFVRAMRGYGELEKPRATSPARAARPAEASPTRARSRTSLDFLIS
jgi:hypothetical protein